MKKTNNSVSHNSLLKISATVLIILTALIFTGCKYCTDNLFYSGNYVHERVSEGLKILKGNDNPSVNSSKYNILLLSDTHFVTDNSNQDISKMQQNLFSYLDKLKGTTELPAFCVCSGDLADTGNEEEYKYFVQFTDKLYRDYNIKTYNVIGNHDCYQSGWKNWKRFCYPYYPFYKFTTNKFSYYVIDTGTAYLGEKQFSCLKKDMENDPNPKIIFSHYPLYTTKYLFCMEDTAERNELIELLANNNTKYYVSGHIHTKEIFDFGAFKEFTLASFRYQKQWGILSVDEQTGIVTATHIN